MLCFYYAKKRVLSIGMCLKGGQKRVSFEDQHHNICKRHQLLPHCNSLPFYGRATTFMYQRENLSPIHLDGNKFEFRFAALNFQADLKPKISTRDRHQSWCTKCWSSTVEELFCMGKIIINSFLDANFATFRIEIGDVETNRWATAAKTIEGRQPCFVFFFFSVVIRFNKSFCVFSSFVSFSFGSDGSCFYA